MTLFDTKLKILLIAGVVGAALIAAPASATTNIFLNTAGIYNPATVHIANPAGDEYVYDGPVVFQANYGLGSGPPTFNFLGFCVDIYHNISVGINGQSNLGLQYQTKTFDRDGNGGVLGATTIAKIANLVTIGTNIWKASARPSFALNANDAFELAAIQGAIWQVETGYNVYGGSLAGLDSRTDYYAGLMPSGHNSIQVIYNYDPTKTAALTSGGRQAFAFAVPEPATWLMMIMGFGSVGAVLRRRRQSVVFA